MFLFKKLYHFPHSSHSLPLLGSLPFVSGDGPRPSLFHGSRSLVEKYGKVVGFHVGRMPAVLVSDFSALREVLRSADACSRPPIYPFNQAKAGHQAPNLEGRGPGILLSQVKKNHHLISSMLDKLFLFPSGPHLERTEEVRNEEPEGFRLRQS